MAEERKILLSLDFDVSDSTKRSAELNKEISDLNKKQKELKKSGQEGSVQFAENAAQLRALKKEQTDTNKTIDNLTKANNAQAGSNEQLRAQLSLLTADYNKLSKEQRENSEEGQQLNAQINAITQELKENEEAVGDNRRSVGDYGKALQGTPFGGFISGIQAMGRAFLANPIGLVITAIVAAFAALRKAFLSTEEGQNKLSKAFGVIGTIIGKVFDVLEPLASFIFDKVAGAFEFLGEVAESAGRLVSDVLSFFGFDDAAEGLANFIDEAEEAARLAAQVADQRAEADVLERELIVDRAKAEAQIAEARRKSQDIENATAEERKKALEEAARAADELAAKEEKEAQLRFEALKTENSLTNSNKEAKKAEAEAEAALIQIQTKRASIQKSLLTDLRRVNNEIAKEEKAQEAERQKAADEARKRAEERLKAAIDQQKLEIELFIQQQGIRAKTLAEEVRIAEQVADKRLAVLEREKKAGIINETEYQLERLKIQQELGQQRAELAVENADRELQQFIERNQSIIDNEQMLTDELLVKESERLTAIAEQRKEFEKTRLEQGIITELEYNDAIDAINEERLQQQEELNDKALEQREQQRLKEIEREKAISMANLQNQREIDLLNRRSEFELRAEDLERQREQELQAAEEIGADTLLIKEKYDALEKQLDRDRVNFKLDLASQAFANAASIAGQESAVGKSLAIAQATIDTYKAAQAAYASLSTVPVVGPALGALAAAAAVNAGLQNVRKIISTPEPEVSTSAGGTKRAAKGGVFGGKPHSGGGTKGYFDDGTQIEVEKGELFAVVNKKNTSLLSGLSALNSFGGNGVPFFERGGAMFLQDGGIGLSNLSVEVDNQESATNQILTAIQNMPAPVVAVQDINEVQSDTAQVEARAIV